MAFKIKYRNEVIIVFNYTALHIAIKNENIEIIKLLINYVNIDINAKNGAFFIIYEIIWNYLWFFIYFWETPIELAKNEQIRSLFNK